MVNFGRRLPRLPGQNCTPVYSPYSAQRIMPVMVRPPPLGVTAHLWRECAETKTPARGRGPESEIAELQIHF